MNLAVSSYERRLCVDVFKHAHMELVSMQWLEMINSRQSNFIICEAAFAQNDYENFDHLKDVWLVAVCV